MSYELIFEAEPFPAQTEFADLEEFDLTYANLETDETWLSEVIKGSEYKTCEHLLWIRRSLNEIMYKKLKLIQSPLPENGRSLDKRAEQVLSDFQKLANINPDASPGPTTKAALLAAGASTPPFHTGSPMTTLRPAPSKEPPIGNAPLPKDAKGVPLSDFPGVRKASRRFLEKVVAIAGRLKTDPNYLLAIISFESWNSFSPSKMNKSKNPDAIGLFQFRRSTACDMGVTWWELGSMTAEQQLDYVEKQLERKTGSLIKFRDVYMAVFYPRAVGAKEETILYTKANVSRDNKAMADSSGNITVKSAVDFVKRGLKDAAKRNPEQEKNVAKLE